MTQRYLHHVTLNTGHARQSPRSEVQQAVIDDLLPMMGAITKGQLVPIPSCSGYSMSGIVLGRCALFKVSAGSDLVAVIGVSLHSRCGAGVWKSLHDANGFPTNPERQPPAPWCAARLETGIANHPECVHWLGDFERCLAWAFIEWRQR